MAAENEKSQKSIWSELRDASLPWLVLGSLVIAFGYGSAVVYLLWPIGLPTIEKLGQFGDSFGVLTSLLNALAFAAVVATVVLQSRELRETREELKAQADAQREWARSAEKQLELTARIEATRQRPFLKVEWRPSPESANSVTCIVRNVGNGVAIVRAIEFSNGSEVLKIFEQSGDAWQIWKTVLSRALETDVQQFQIQMMQFDDLNRALAAGELQAVATISNPIISGRPRESLIGLRERLGLVIVFESADGVAHRTDSQFELLGQSTARTT